MGVAATLPVQTELEEFLCQCGAQLAFGKIIPLSNWTLK